METATYAGGCFWCTEAIFKRLKGVESVLPGYSGGEIENPTYEEVCSGETGHAEAIQIVFNPKSIPFKKLLEIFFYTHDPTALNRQGNDIGTQYRSLVFYHTQKQKIESEEFIKDLERKHRYSKPIVTQVLPFKNFYEAEDYHKNYFDRNKGVPYCNISIAPKIHKLMEKYGKEVKDEFKNKDY
jgi:peptide-methionine (S)-S-oxide reductase